MKKITALFLALAMVLGMTACSNSSSSSGSGSGSGDKITIKFSMSHAANEPAVVAANNFAERVKEATSGAIEVTVYPDNQLGGERDVVEGLQLHTVEMVDPANAVFTNFVEEATIFEMPMLFDSKEHCKAVCDGMGDELYADACAEAGFKFLGFLNVGTRHIMTTDKVINSIDDLKGLKIRTQEGAANVAAFNAFGASATPMAYNELYTSLESGVLDGAEASNVNYLSKAFYEVAPNWAICGWIELLCPILLDMQVWEKMTEEQQAIFQEEVDAMIDEEWALYEQSEAESLATLEESGITITYPDVEPFREASKTVWEEFADTFGGMEQIEAIINYEY